MTYLIREAFELHFHIGPEEANDGPSPVPDFHSRRWFRRPPPGDQETESNSSVGPDIAAAQEILVAKLQEAAPTWVERTQQGRGGKAEGAAAAPTQIDPIRHIPLRMPYDVFAIAAYLVESAGIYHHLQPTKSAKPPRKAAGKLFESRHLEITFEDRKIVDAAAEAWSRFTIGETMEDAAKTLTGPEVWPKIAPLFESWWIVFGLCGDDAIFQRLGREEKSRTPIWWKHAWRLLAISDEAARGTAFEFDLEKISQAVAGEATEIRWFEMDVLMEHIQRALAEARTETPVEIHGTKRKEFGDITTLSVARQTVASVLPKVRTPAVGCTLRSLSHHLALLPPAGVARGRWTPNYSKPQRESGSMPEGVMNLLLVPLPYSLSAQCFKPAMVEDVSGGERGQVPRFGYFDVEQSWISGAADRPEKIITFVQALIDTAQKQCPAVHGIVFPELSLDYGTFERVREHIRKHLPTADLLISGVSSNREGRRGNFVAVASFQDAPSGGERDYRQTVREKHHRWKLERTQLKDYGLLGVLSPELSWWENIDLQSRRVDFTVMRRDSVFAAMICEDLARVDPCQQVIRSVGPNLVVALLMDAPQRAERWPARYATVLAEDPGCAVLTLTSRGLMTRQHRLGTFRSNGDDRYVGMWRDDRNAAPTLLRCPYDAQAVLLTIVEEKAEDISLDGRSDGEAKAWRYAGDVPVRVADAKSEFRIILGEDDLSCW